MRCAVPDDQGALIPGAGLNKSILLQPGARAPFLGSMSDTEQLTADERGALEYEISYTENVGGETDVTVALAKALRIIDAQSKRIVDLEAPFRAAYNAGFTTANANATGSNGVPFGFEAWMRGGAR